MSSCGDKDLKYGKSACRYNEGIYELYGIECSARGDGGEFSVKLRVWSLCPDESVLTALSSVDQDVLERRRSKGEQNEE